MPRYISLAKPSRQFDDDWYFAPEQVPTMQVLQDDDSPRPTGLLDKRGVEIYAVPDRRKIGFG